MKKIIFVFFMIFFSHAAPEAALDADIPNGKKLFNNPALGGGSTGKTCNTCHEDGLDLSVNLADKNYFHVMGITMDSAAEVVNFCIEVTLRGEAIDENGKQMRDLLAYMKILAGKGGGRKYKDLVGAE